MSEDLNRDELIQLLNNPELLRFYGYQLTPKGAMALVLLTEFPDLDEDRAEKIAAKIEDLIFLSEYIYVHQNQIEVKDPSE